MEHQDPMFEEETPADQAKRWIQENLRIIVSIFIVAAIALGIYNYSQRTQTALPDDDNMLLDTVGDATATPEPVAVTPPSITNNIKTETATTPELGRETEGAFVEKATAGDGTTHLARRALMHYLEKSADSSLTAEHKVYIEDYLRKNVPFSGMVTTDTSIEFSKDLIRQAIDHSKTLNDRQLHNLKKYSARVSAYR